MNQRDDQINFKRLRFWIFVGGFSIFVIIVGIVKQLIIYFGGH